MTQPLIFCGEERGYLEVDKSREFLDGMDPEKRARLPIRACLPECRAELNSVDEAKHTVDFVISTEKPVRDSFYDPPASLAANGMVTEGRYAENPIVCFMHDYTAAIARTLKLWTLGKKNLARAEFDYADEVGKYIFGKVQRGYIKMASVGFRKLEWYDIAEGVKDRATGLTGPVRRVTKWELIEWSVVTIGANPEALGRSLAGVMGPVAATRALMAPFQSKPATARGFALAGEQLLPALRLEEEDLLPPFRLQESDLLN